MSSEADLEEAKNEVLMKIGRNVLFYQQMEHKLKYLTSSSGVSGYESEIKKKLENQSKRIENSTMGRLVGVYSEILSNENDGNSADIPTDKEVNHRKEIYQSISLKFPSEDNENYKESLKDIVRQRNFLIHNILSDLNLNSIESCKKTSIFLEQQREEALPIWYKLDSHVQALRSSREIFSSEEFKKLLELNYSPLIWLLADTSGEMRSNDGWVTLRRAGQLIHESKLKKEMVKLKKKFNCRTLEELIRITGTFEIKNVPTDKEENCISYRLIE